MNLTQIKPKTYSPMRQQACEWRVGTASTKVFHEHRQRTRGVDAVVRHRLRDHDRSLKSDKAVWASGAVGTTAAKTLETVVVGEVRKTAERGSWCARLSRSVVVKRYFDIVLSIVLLVVLSPLLLVIAAAVRRDSGRPVVIAQSRNGHHKHEFRALKFRTMTVVEDGHDAVQCTSDDPRVTRVGDFLRRTGLDELPQLLNVLKGEMSLVGPRPHPIGLDQELSKYIVGYERRFAAIPGISGLAQVRGFRGPVETRAQIWNRVAADVEYIENRTVIGDLWILLRTVAVVFSSCRRA